MNDKRKAVSYSRFSTIAQGNEGRDSTRRQQEALRAALAKWNLELESSFVDAGKSGYKMRHLAKGGAMHQLCDMAVNGELKNKVLIIEDFDRAGRMQVTDAAPLLMSLLNNGVDLVVGANGGDYFSKATVNKNPFLFYKALDEMNRGHRESRRKTDMAKSKYQQRMEAMASGKPIGLNNTPFWIDNERNERGDCTGKFYVRKGMDKLVQDIFDLYIRGDGTQIISRKLTKRGIPLPTRKNGEVRKNVTVWGQTMIRNLIKDRAVIGYYHNTEYKVFPAIISESLFYQANQKMKERTRFAGKKVEHVNPYSGLCWCANCKGKFSRHSSRMNQKTVDKYVYLQCRSSQRGLCSASGIPYPLFEKSFASFLCHIEDLGKPKEATSDTSKCDTIKNQIAHVERRIVTIKAAFEKIEDTSKAVSLATMLTDYDIQLVQLKKELEDETIKEKGSVNFDKQQLEYLKQLFGKENKLQDPATRQEIQEALRNAIDRITIDVKSHSYTVTWKNSPNVFKVQFTKQGFEVSGDGCVNFKITDFDSKWQWKTKKPRD